MNFLAPAYLYAAGLAAAAVVALHFIVTRDPKSVPLPTARFVPNRPLQARARAIHLSDLLLLACRVGLLLLVGAALAHPVIAPRRRAVTRLVLVDRSADVANPAEASDSARRLTGPGDRAIAFDSAAPVARISAGLIRSLQAAASLREETDSFELVIVAPLLAHQLDQATDSLRMLWPAAIRLVPVAARVDSSTAPAIVLEGAPDDPLRVALPVSATGSDDPAVRLIRGGVTAADSGWARGAGHVLVEWPAAFPESLHPDSIGGVTAGSAVVIAPFFRPGRLAVPAGGRVVARWVDGEAAGVEAPTGTGCLRRVQIPVPARGDLVLDARFAALVAQMTAPCGGHRPAGPLNAADRAALAGSGRPARVAAASVPRPEVVSSPLAPWLVGLALVLALGELLLRRRPRAMP